MKQYILPIAISALVFVLAFGSISSAQESDIKTGIRDAVSDTVSASRDAFSGFVEGIQEGRRSGRDNDGGNLVATRADMARLGLKAEVRTLERKADGAYEITLALNNPNDFPVRLVNLSDIRNIVVVDKDGFSYSLDNPLVQGRDVTALGRSATRLRYSFSGLEARPAVFRLYDTDVNIP